MSAPDPFAPAATRGRAPGAGRVFAGAALVTLVLWAVFTWPLPRLVGSAMPYAARVPGQQVGLMIPGDHLQLLYHFWLFDDMLAGHTPWFHNLYEFNTGDDAARREPGTYYLPFSAFFALGDHLGGRAFGWNLACFGALWLGYAFTVLLARRYCRSPGVAWAAALPVLMLPFRWDALLGGSPLGFAMLWVPALMLGLDLAVRDGRLAGGLLAGLALVGAATGDLHVLAFAILCTPVCGAIALLLRPDFRWRCPRDYGRIALALLPVLVGAAVVAALRMAASRELGASTMAVGRDVREVLNFSPHWKGAFLHRVVPVSNQIYIGFVAPALIALGAALMAARGRTDRGGARDWRPLALMLLSLLITAVVFILALGPRDPFGGQLFRLVRRLVPPYAMIRQPAKIYCLMPPLLAIMLALALDRLAALRPGARGRTASHRWALAVPALAAALMLIDYRPQVRPGLTILRRDEPAYAAVARDAAARHTPPRALVVALWPGDTHYTSIYQYNASLYRIRMANGYSPVVNRDYRESFFPRFSSLNQGYATDAQLDELLARGIDYVLVHEDLFPEKVSPFPITFTLKNLLNHPRLDLLARDGSVWALRIRAAADPSPRTPVGADWTTWFPTRRWEAEKGPHAGAEVVDAGAVGGHAVALRGGGDYIGVLPTTVAPAPNLRFLVRVRGRGVIQPMLLNGTNTLAMPAPIPIDAAAWDWIEIPAPELADTTPLGLKLVGTDSRAVEVDSLLLAAGTWAIAPAVGETITWPAAIFFHAGHLDPASNTVAFQAGAQGGGVWYGPKMPLAPGTYRLTLAARVAAPPGTRAGALVVSVSSGDLPSVPVLAGQATEFLLTKSDNLPFNAVFDYAGTVDTTLERLTLTRVR